MSKESPEEFAARRRAEYVEALEFEREGYKRRGLTDRVRQVDARLAELAPKDARPAPKRDTTQHGPRSKR